ncbi:MAG: hypothetical protein ACE5JB_01085 [bacterium]
MKQKKVKQCLREKEIEIFVLQEQLCIGGNEVKISNHIKICNKCCKRYFELRRFHQILSMELKKPISSQILNLVEGLQSN